MINGLFSLIFLIAFDFMVLAEPITWYFNLFGIIYLGFSIHCLIEFIKENHEEGEGK